MPVSLRPLFRVPSQFPRLPLPALLQVALPLLLLLGLCPAQAQAQNLKISEFRLSGPGGAQDEFIEIYNFSNVPYDAERWTVGSSATRITIPAGKRIPAYGCLLVTGTGYSLSDYSGAGAATGDLSYSDDIPNGSALQLRDASGNLVDQVTLSNLPLPLSWTDNYSYLRRLDSASPQDTDNDQSDFNLVDVQSTEGANSSTGVSSGIIRLGAPGPQNRHSLIPNNSILTLVAASPATVRVGSGNSGTLALRRIVTNRADNGRTVTALRFRMVAITAGVTSATNSTGGAMADIRLRSSTVSDGTILPLALQQPPAQPNGGGLNATVITDLSVLPGGGLAPGQSITVEFLFDIFKSGTYALLLNAEPDPSPAQPDIAVRPIADDEEPGAVPAEADWTGAGVFTGDGSNQTVSAVTMIGLTRRFALRLTNAGDKGMAFRIHLPDPPPGWTQHLFDAASGGSEILLTDQNWGTPDIAPGAALTLRLEATPSAAATADYAPVIGAWSNVVLDAVKVVCPLQKIAKLQWSRDGQSWQDVNSTPLSVDQYEVIAFRAVPTQSSISWDALPDFKPEWSSQGETHWGEVVWQHFPTAGTVAITAECGNQATASVQVAEAS